MDDDDDVPGVVRQKLEQHPECGLEKSVTQSCSSKDGSMQCDVKEDFLMRCPGKAPVRGRLFPKCAADE